MYRSYMPMLFHRYRARVIVSREYSRRLANGTCQAIISVPFITLVSANCKFASPTGRVFALWSLLFSFCCDVD